MRLMCEFVLYMVTCVTPALNTPVNLFGLWLNPFDLHLSRSAVTALIHINLCTFLHELTTPSPVYSLTELLHYRLKATFQLFALIDCGGITGIRCPALPWVLTEYLNK